MSLPSNRHLRVKFIRRRAARRIKRTMRQIKGKARKVRAQPK